jgi:hypothetical protein
VNPEVLVVLGELDLRFENTCNLVCLGKELPDNPDIAGLPCQFEVSQQDSQLV